jgi:hypothetical protein
VVNFLFISGAFPVLVSRDREAERVMAGVRVGQDESTRRRSRFRYKWDGGINY